MFKTNFVLSVVVSSLLLGACGTRNTGSGGTPVPPPAAPTTPVATGETPSTPQGPDRNHPRPDGGTGRGDHGGDHEGGPGHEHEHDHDGGPERDHDHDGGTRVQMQIIDAGKLFDISTDDPDRPDFYAIDGRVVPARGGAWREMRRGATGCPRRDQAGHRRGRVPGTRRG